MKRILCILISLLLCLLCMAGCSKNTDTTDTTSPSAKSAGSDTAAESSQVKVTMENGDSFVIEVYPEFAPATCENFLSLVQSHFYDGKTFHRVIDGFMAQGGSSDGIGIEGSGTTIKGEFANNGFTQNTLSHTRGVVSMARQSGNNDSASSQFFICYSDMYASTLDGNYAAFGKVIEGMDVVDAFCKVEREVGSDDHLSKPIEPIVIQSMEVL